MAYMKYKELTKSFYFYKPVPVDNLPKYITDYVGKNEKILGAYSTARDKGILTDRKIILFDVYGIQNNKQITILPYNSISSTSIIFKKTAVSLLMYMDSGYPVTLKFIRQTPEGKKHLRIIFTYINNLVPKI